MVEMLVFLVGCAALCLSFVGFSLFCMAVVAEVWSVTIGGAFPPLFVLSLSPVLGLAMVAILAGLWEHRPKNGEKR